MTFTADMHIHSRFSRACSPKLDLKNLAETAKVKGLDLLGTGDFLHPSQLSDISRQLSDSGEGLFELDGVKFILSCEVSLTYSHNGRLRRVHLLVLMPSLEDVKKLTVKLKKMGAKLESDGRPIMGISSKNFLEICLEINPKAIVFPAHAWTPWFGVFGSKSGYDSLKEAFEDLTDYVYAVETGLSSDPVMNWLIKELDNKSIVSFSDPHSLPNLAREATIFDCDLSYEGIFQALKQPSVIANPEGVKQSHVCKGIASSPLVPRNDVGVLGTIEFYPQEGKYHWDGHRNCKFSQSPEETSNKGANCPVCGRHLTIGVGSRVAELAGRSNDELRIMNNDGWVSSKAFPEKAKYRMLVQLEEVIAESFGVGIQTKKVRDNYQKLISEAGNELNILMNAPLINIAKFSGERVAQSVDKVRRGELLIKPGFDGVYGEIKIWENR